MSGGSARRYPHAEHVSRDRLGPTGTHGPTVEIRDEHQCLAVGLAASTALPCTDDLVVVSALTAEHLDRDLAGATGSPLFLRTFCTAHADLDLRDPDTYGWNWVENGWRIPPRIDDVVHYASLLPVRTWGPRWWLLDHWGERRLMPAAYVADRLTELRQWWTE